MLHSSADASRLAALRLGHILQYSSLGAPCEPGASTLSMLTSLPRRNTSRNEAVVLLHGMGRTWISMALLGWRLRRAGYEVHHFGYRPRRESLDVLSERLHALARKRIASPRYHFIGHSLGNVIVRHGFRNPYREGLGRLVMLAPPNGPASLASGLRGNALYQWWTGDSGQKLGDEAFYRELPVPDVEFGVIAGDLGPSFAFGEPNDGVVRVENTKLEGMKDWVVVHHTHTLIMMAADTFELCARFLETGQFEEASGEDYPAQPTTISKPPRGQARRSFSS